jgi:hypothetical protein
MAPNYILLPIQTMQRVVTTFCFVCVTICTRVAATGEESALGSFDEYWDAAALRYWNRNDERDITAETFWNIFCEVWLRSTYQQDIVSSFREAEIYLFDDAVTPDSTFAASDLTFIQPSERGTWCVATDEEDSKQGDPRHVRRE